MKIIDIEVKKALTIIRSEKLRNMMDNVHESDSKSDMDIFIDCIRKIIEEAEDGKSNAYKKLSKAKHIIKDTKNGKIMPPDPYVKGRSKYKEQQVQEAKNIVNEYKRLQNWYDRLSKINT